MLSNNTDIMSVTYGTKSFWFVNKIPYPLPSARMARAKVSCIMQVFSSGFGLGHKFWVYMNIVSRRATHYYRDDSAAHFVRGRAHSVGQHEHMT